jgi:hypothetical protein
MPDESADAPQQRGPSTSIFTIAPILFPVLVGGSFVLFVALSGLKAYRRYRQQATVTSVQGGSTPLAVLRITSGHGAAHNGSSAGRSLYAGGAPPAAAQGHRVWQPPAVTGPGRPAQQNGAEQGVAAYQAVYHTAESAAGGCRHGRRQVTAVVCDVLGLLRSVSQRGLRAACLASVSRWIDPARIV